MRELHFYFLVCVYIAWQMHCRDNISCLLLNHLLLGGSARCLVTECGMKLFGNKFYCVKCLLFLNLFLFHAKILKMPKNCSVNSLKFRPTAL